MKPPVRSLPGLLGGQRGGMCGAVNLEQAVPNHPLTCALVPCALPRRRRACL